MGNAGWGMSAGQHCIRGQVALAPLGFDEIPIMNVENACAGGASAFHGAWLGVAAGAYDVALAIGAEKLSIPPSAGIEGKKKGLNSFIAGTDVEVTTKLIQQMQAEAERKRKELEASGKVKEGRERRRPAAPSWTSTPWRPEPTRSATAPPRSSWPSSPPRTTSTAPSIPTPSTA